MALSPSEYQAVENIFNAVSNYGIGTIEINSFTEYVRRSFGISVTVSDIHNFLLTKGYVGSSYSSFEYVPSKQTRLTYGTSSTSEPITLTPVEDDTSVKMKKKQKHYDIKLNNVVMPPEKLEQIKAAVSQINHSDKIFNEWGFGDVFEKGTAISLLFWGIPGTGKTLTAQAIAEDVGADLKVIGTADIETAEPGGAERTIRELFSQANSKNKSTHHNAKQVILLFDECDSLLMDRNEVGPIISAQINTLLQELEKYTGIIIFTTNRLGKLDAALERRISAKIEFEFPDAKARKHIWNKLIPKKAPIAKDVEMDKLSNFPLAGGNIKNVILNTARMAAYLNTDLTMDLFVESIEKEARAIKAFIDQYKNHSHPTILSHAALARQPGKIGITRKKKMDMVMQEVASSANAS